MTATELLPADEEQLAEIRQVHLAGVVLQVRVRQEREGRVEDRASARASPCRRD